MEKVHVSIDNYVSIPALIDPDERWNGWACPWFAADDVPLIQQTLDLFDQGETIEYDSDDDAYFIRVDCIEERYYGKDIDGQHLYPIGNGLWVWHVDE